MCFLGGRPKIETPGGGVLKKPPPAKIEKIGGGKLETPPGCEKTPKGKKLKKFGPLGKKIGGALLFVGPLVPPLCPKRVFFLWGKKNWFVEKPKKGG